MRRVPIRFQKTSSVSTSLFAALLCITSSAIAQDDLPEEEALMLEEIVVTARKRPESLQDVPASVNAVSGDKLASAGITKIEQLSAYVPNLTMSETGIGTNIYIRGIGSGINQGFEQSVGMYVDGVYYGRAQLSRSPFLDLAQVEVLRGPQGVLFGKNSIAGAISMTTQRPSDDTEMSISLLFEPEYNETEVVGVLSGRITDMFGARLAVRYKEADGYIENLTSGDDEPDREEETVRLVLDFSPTDTLDITLKAEAGQFDVVGRQVEILDDYPVLDRRGIDDGRPAQRFTDFIGLNWSQIVQELASGPDNFAAVPFAPETGFDNTGIDYKRGSNGDFSNNDTENLTLTVNYQWGEFSVTAITGFLSYDYEELCDCDFNANNGIDVFGSEDYEQFSQELRILSPAENDIEYLFGLFIQTSELDFNESLLVNESSVLGPLAQNASGLGKYGVSKDIARVFTQDSEVFALFGQMTFNMTERLSATLGGRITWEKKEGYRQLEFKEFDGTPLLPENQTLTPIVYSSLFLAEQHEEKGTRHENKFTPALSFQYEVAEDFMAYTSFSRGFKSGGFDARSNTGTGTVPTSIAPGLQAGAFEYEEEEAKSFEIGAKIGLADGLAEVNVAFFKTNYENMQMSVFDGVLGFNVRNAAAAETEGVELEGRWLVASGLTLAASVATLQFEFKDFPLGQCYFETRNASNFCSYDGKTNQYVADYSGTIALDYVSYVAGNLVLTSTVDFNFTDEYLPTQNLDPSVVQDEYTSINARISIGAEDETWTVALVGKNLTDEEIITYANDTPVASGSVEAKGHYAFVAPPRTLALQLSYKY